MRQKEKIKAMQVEIRRLGGVSIPEDVSLSLDLVIDPAG